MTKRVLALLVLAVVGGPCCFCLEGGSERLKDIELSLETFQEIVEDKEHIQEELNSIFTEDIEAMEREEVAFNWFYFPEKFRATPVFLPLLPTEDGELDGLELYKSVIHSLFEVRGGYAAESGQMPQVSEQKAKETEELVDDLLLRYDLNEDALLNYKEFMKSFQENHKLNSV